VTGGWFCCPRPLEGLAGLPGELPWLGLPLRERQERAFLERRLSVHPAVVGRDPDPAPGPRLLVREDVALGAATADDAAAMGQRLGRDLSFRLSGRSGAFAEDIALGRDEPLLVYLHEGIPTLERIQAAEVALLDPRERLVEVPVPGEAGVALVELPLTERLLLPAGHWLQLLWANLLGLAPFLWRGLAGRNVVEAAFHLGWAVLHAGSLHPPTIATVLGRRGRGTRVHPRAVVEGCWLGDGVEIGAGAVVRGCVIADGALIEEQALVEFSILAAGARIQRQALVKLSVVGVRASVGGLVQLGVIDREAQVKVGAHLMDMAVDQGVRVQVGDRLAEAPLGLAGVCVGAGTLVGSGVRVAPGRALPAGLAILPPPETVLVRIPRDLQGTVCVRDGTLVSVHGGPRGRAR